MASVTTQVAEFGATLRARSTVRFKLPVGASLPLPATRGLKLRLPYALKPSAYTPVRCTVKLRGVLSV